MPWIYRQQHQQQQQTLIVSRGKPLFNGVSTYWHYVAHRHKTNILSTHWLFSMLYAVAYYATLLLPKRNAIQFFFQWNCKYFRVTATTTATYTRTHKKRLFKTEMKMLTVDIKRRLWSVKYYAVGMVYFLYLFVPAFSLSLSFMSIVLFPVNMVDCVAP